MTLAKWIPCKQANKYGSQFPVLALLLAMTHFNLAWNLSIVFVKRQKEEEEEIILEVRRHKMRQSRKQEEDICQDCLSGY